MLQINKYFLNLEKKRQNYKKRAIWRKLKVHRRNQLIKKVNFLFAQSVNVFLKLCPIGGDQSKLSIYYTFYKSYQLAYKFISFGRIFFLRNQLFWMKYMFNIFFHLLYTDKYSKHVLTKKPSNNLFYFRIFKKRIKKNYSFLKLFNLSSCYQHYDISKKLLNFSLLQRIFISKKLVYFFFKNIYKKNKNFKLYKIYHLISKVYKREPRASEILIRQALPLHNNNNFNRGSSYYFFDNNKSPLRAMLGARKIYQKFSRKKTLRNVAYKKFVKRELKLIRKNPQISTNVGYVLRLYKFAVTWTQTMCLIKLGFIFLNGQRIFNNVNLLYNDIFQIVNIAGLNYLKLYFSYKKFKLLKKIKHNSYIKFLSYNKLWMSKKKNSTYLINWLYPHTMHFSKFLLFDYFTFTGIILEALNKHYYSTDYQIYNSPLLPLYVWKFRAT